MALMQIEKSPDLLFLLRDSVSFYMAHIETLKTNRAESVEDLAKDIEQLKQMKDLRDRTQQELNSLLQRKREVEASLGNMGPYLSLIDKIESIEAEVRGRQRRLRIKQEDMDNKVQEANSKFDEELSEEVKRAAAIFRGEKLSEDFITGRLASDLTWYRERLHAAKVDSEEIRRQAKAVRTQTEKLDEAILQKEGALSNIEDYLKTHGADVSRLEGLERDLRRYETDFNNLVVLIKILSEVSLDAIATTEQAGT